MAQPPSLRRANGGIGDLAWVCLRISLRISNFCRLWSNRNAQTRPALAHMDKLFLDVVAIGLIVLIAAGCCLRPRRSGPPLSGRPTRSAGRGIEKIERGALAPFGGAPLCHRSAGFRISSETASALAHATL